MLKILARFIIATLLMTAALLVIGTNRVASAQTTEPGGLILNSPADVAILDSLSDLLRNKNEVGRNLIKAMEGAKDVIQKLDAAGTKLNCVVLDGQDVMALKTVVNAYEDIIAAAELLLKTEETLLEHLQVIHPEKLRAEIRGHKTFRGFFSRILMQEEAKTKPCEGRKTPPPPTHKSRPERTALFLIHTPRT